MHRSWSSHSYDHNSVSVHFEARAVPLIPITHPDGEEEEKKEKEEEKEEKEKSEKMVQLWRPEKFQRDCIINDPSVTCGSLGKVAGSDGQEFRSTNENASQVKAVVGVKQAPEVSTRRLQLSSSRARPRKTQSEVGSGRVPEVPRLECVGKGMVCQQMRNVQLRIHRLRLVTVQK